MRPVAQIAQSVEQGIENPRVGGSIPSLGTTNTEKPQAKLNSLGFFIACNPCPLPPAGAESILPGNSLTHARNHRPSRNGQDFVLARQPALAIRQAVTWLALSPAWPLGARRSAMLA